MHSITGMTCMHVHLGHEHAVTPKYRLERCCIEESLRIPQVPIYCRHNSPFPTMVGTGTGLRTAYRYIPLHTTPAVEHEADWQRCVVMRIRDSQLD